MIFSAESQKTIDGYLTALRKQLRELMDDDVNDIVDEIRFHILDKTSDDASPESIASTLAGLGTPEELASRYRTDELMKRAQSSGSPLLTLRSLFRWATLSLVGLIVFIVSVFGYCLGGGLVLLAGLKILLPHKTGLWMEFYPDHTPKSVSMGFGSGYNLQPPQGHEVLGWWLVPIGLLIGSGLLLLTFRFGSWCILKFWRPRALRAVSTALGN